MFCKVLRITDRQSERKIKIYNKFCNIQYYILCFFNKIPLQDVSEVNIQDEASTVFSRAKQFTEEKLGRTERTEYDLEFQQMEKKTDLTKSYTEKIKNNTAAVIIPNPSKKWSFRETFRLWI